MRRELRPVSALPGGLPDLARFVADVAGRVNAGTWGRDDRVSPLDMALIPMRTIPNAELHVFPNCGHWAMIEAKEAFDSTVLAFLTR